MFRHVLIAAGLLPSLMIAAPSLGQDADPFAPLYAGPAAQAQRVIAERVDADATQTDRFALGVAQTLGAIERLTQAMNRHGLQTDAMWGLAQLGIFPPTPIENPADEPIDAATFRAIVERFNADLGAAERTLAAVEPDGELKAVFDVARVRLDYDGDGEAGEDEALARLMGQLQRGRAARADDQAPASFPIALDAGDVYWLQGYCNLLLATTDFVLAHDTDMLFNHTAHMFFADADTPFASFADAPKPGGFNMSSISDYIAFIHLLRLEVEDPQRMASALRHLRAVSKLSRASWKAILAETDDDREWIPAPDQENSVLGNDLVSAERLEAWMSFLDEYDAIFAGEKLVPFWRGNDPTRGVNLARAFEQPRTFDLILWVQGTAAVPYLEEGELTTPAFWGQLNRAFQGEFMMFAVIVN